MVASLEAVHLALTTNYLPLSSASLKRLKATAGVIVIDTG